MDMPKVTAIGHLACDPQPGRGTVKLSLVTTYNGEDNRVRAATVAIYAQGALAEICELYLRRGYRIYCEARIEHEGYIAEEIILLAKQLTGSTGRVT